MKFYQITAVALACLLGSTASAREYTDAPVRDAWLDGKLETAYLFNRHLNSFTIDTEVKDGVAYLSGTVESKIDKSLAEEIAQGIDGIEGVKSAIVVEKTSQVREVPARMNTADDADKRSFREWFDDVTTTAAVKSHLVANTNTSAMKIDVDTRYNVVTLSGEVSSAEEKELAAQIASNTGQVKEVHNELTVK